MPKADLDTFASDLREFRRAANLTQEECAAEIGISARSLMRYERGEVAPSKSNLRLIEAWFSRKSAEFDAGQLAVALGTSEVDRLRADLASLRKQYQIQVERLRDEYKNQLQLIDRIQELENENNRLRAEVQALRAQAAAAVLGPEEGRLMVRAGELLSLPPNASLEQILERVVGIFTAAKDESRPTVHEPEPHGKKEEGGGGEDRKRRQANSS